MSIDHSRPVVVDSKSAETSLNAGSNDLLIKEARRRQRRRWSAFLIPLIVVAVTSTVTAIQLTSSSKPKVVSPTSIKSFETLFRHGSHIRFVATYRVHDYTFYPAGTIVYSQIPSPPGTKAVENADGYSGTGRYAYVYRGNGRIVQWIQIGTNVSACMRLPAPYFTTLKCDQSSPFIPSNGFSEEGVGLIQQQVQSWDYLRDVPPKGWTVTTEQSNDFGPLRCLTLPQLSTKTCINNQGIVVSWINWNGATITGHVSLMALNYHPTSRDFETLIRPTSKFFLPPQ
jgi:hypothetical protein